MRTIEAPGAPELFDKFAGALHPRLVAKLESSWEGMMRRVLLQLMPAKELGKKMSDKWGRPSKELYSMAGLIFLAESFDWTHEEAARRYSCDAGVQYALNLPHYNQYVCERTYENRLRDFRQSDLAQRVFDEVTSCLISELDIEIKKQRLDSTHVFSDMAQFGRTKLLAATTRRFLGKLERSFPQHYGALSSELVQRYKKSDAQLFGMGRSRLTGEQLGLLRSQIACDMHQLITHFENDKAIVALRGYAALVRVFTEQCELVGGTPTLVPKVGSRCMQNPSDPDASYDGHKGPGYQAQIAESFGEENEVNLITAVIPETAADQDADAVIAVVEQLEQRGLKPDILVADTAYGSDENVQAAKEHEVILVAPVAGAHKKKSADEAGAPPMDVLDFARDEQTSEVIQCPMGNKPLATGSDDAGRHSAIFDKKQCMQCPRQQQCPTASSKTKDRIDYSDKEVRLGERRRHEQTKEFRDVYRCRAGIEGTMSALKRGLGFGRLSVRGISAVATAIYLKAAAYNMKQAVRALKKKGLCPKNTLAAAMSVLQYAYERLLTIVWMRHWQSCAARASIGASPTRAA